MNYEDMKAEFERKQKELSQKAFLSAVLSEGSLEEKAKLMAAYYEKNAFHTEQISNRGEQWKFHDFEIDEIVYVACKSGNLGCALHQMNEYLSVFGRAGRLALGEVSEFIRNIEKEMNFELPSSLCEAAYLETIAASSHQNYMLDDSTKEEVFKLLSSNSSAKVSLDTKINNAAKKSNNQISSGNLIEKEFSI